MKTRGTEERRLIFLLLALALLAAPGCAGAKQLDRSSARRMIEASEKFKAPVTAALKEEKEFKIFPDSPDETEQAVRERVLRTYVESHPAIAALRHLGYVDVQVSVIETPRKTVKGSTATTPWVLNIKPALTEKGRVLAKSQGLTGDGGVPLAKRELVEVTGVREQGGQASADFTWKAVPNEAGEALDPSSAAFKSLPQELQAALRKERGIGPFARDATAGWGQVHKATAGFQKYDDGWRLAALSL
ncbi:MAG TPA: hypothetical protein VF736_14360 [Pyrinomonadaceae bacterium]|jgi:hypothetical protein